MLSCDLELIQLHWELICHLEKYQNSISQIWQDVTHNLNNEKHLKDPFFHFLEIPKCKIINSQKNAGRIMEFNST